MTVPLALPPRPFGNFPGVSLWSNMRVSRTFWYGSRECSNSTRSFVVLLFTKPEYCAQALGCKIAPVPLRVTVLQVHLCILYTSRGYNADSQVNDNTQDDKLPKRATKSSSSNDNFLLTVSKVQLHVSWSTGKLFL